MAGASTEYLHEVKKKKSRNFKDAVACATPEADLIPNGHKFPSHFSLRQKHEGSARTQRCSEMCTYMVGSFVSHRHILFFLYVEAASATLP